MTIPLFEQFTGVDWERYSTSGGKALVLITLLASLFDLFHSSSPSFFSLFALWSTWRAPPPCSGRNCGHLGDTNSGAFLP